MSEIETLLQSPAHFRHQLHHATLEELRLAERLLTELIATSRADDEQARLARKGQRVLADMRGLMAKAGVSMDELQAVLPK